MLGRDEKEMWSEERESKVIWERVGCVHLKRVKGTIAHHKDTLSFGYNRPAIWEFIHQPSNSFSFANVVLKTIA